MIRDSVDALLHIAKIVWLIPIPLILIQGVGSYIALTKDLAFPQGEMIVKKGRLKGRRIIYTMTTKGENLATLSDSFRSTNYWINRIKAEWTTNVESEIWIVTEEDSYRRHEAFYTRLGEEGAIVIPTPSVYETPHHTEFKARALHYASQIRLKRGLDTIDDWVYHQDTETMVGEDTILGVLDFVEDSEDGRMIGSGIILYPQDWKYRYNSIEETARSFGDVAAMGQIKRWGAVPFGYHGSHFIVRADVENDIGWDFGKVRSEDLLFITKLREKHGRVMRQLRGFAYEKPPFTARDQLRQRRRWILGSLEVLKRDDVPLRYKTPILYGMASWFSALPSLVVAGLSLIRPTGGLIVFGGLLAGFIWGSITSAYVVGIDLHSAYVNCSERHKGLRTAYGILLGLVFDALAPWYAILARTPHYEEITKDRQ